MGQTGYPPKSRVFKSRFSFEVRQHGPQQLYLQYKVCWILYKLVGATSFSQHYLCIQTPLQFPPKILSSTSVNFQQILQPIPPLLINKIIRSQQSAPKLFSLIQPYSQFRLRQRTRELGGLMKNGTVLISLFFLKVWAVIMGFIIIGSLKLRFKILVCCR